MKQVWPCKDLNLLGQNMCGMFELQHHQRDGSGGHSCSGQHLPELNLGDFGTTVYSMFHLFSGPFHGCFSA
jgi:hypothetical protein